MSLANNIVYLFSILPDLLEVDSLLVYIYIYIYTHVYSYLYIIDHWAHNRSIIQIIIYCHRIIQFHFSNFNFKH